MITRTYLVEILLSNHTLYFTNFDNPIELNGATYQTNQIIDSIQIRKFSDLSTDTLTLTFYNTNMHSLQNSIIKIYAYDTITKTRIEPVFFTGKIESYAQKDFVVTIQAICQKSFLNTDITRNFNKSCQAIWGDSRCTIDKNLYKQDIEITHILNNQITYHVISGQIDQFYNPYLQDINGNPVHIFHHNAASKQFYVEPFIEMTINQHYLLYAGCQKNPHNCQYYNNFHHYLGF